LTQEQLLEGQVILIDKPLKWTSFDVISRLRKIFKIKKIGHAGTLDPLATGLLIVCTGKFTKKINEYMGMEKEYTGTITLGATTPTYDLESEPENFMPTAQLSAAQIHAATLPFTGPIMQVPPAHSAIKIDGKRVYELARAGQEVKMQPRLVTINTFEITRIALPEVDFRVVCSTGTYIRSLAHDFGAYLGTGGYLSALCRTRIGPFSLQAAKDLNYWKAEMEKSNDQG
jgi:tRNA pseudouridine55 synthase